MNQNLVNAICKHLADNLGVTENRKISIMANSFRSKNKIQFKDNQDRNDIAKVWSCQTIVNGSKFRLMCSNLECSHSDYAEQDYIFVVKLDGCPTYGFSTTIWERDDFEGFMACQINEDGNWMQATTYLQATFLAGMEQLKDLTSTYDKCSNEEDLFKSLKEFIVYRDLFIEGAFAEAAEENTVEG